MKLQATASMFLFQIILKKILQSRFAQGKSRATSTSAGPVYPSIVPETELFSQLSNFISLLRLSGLFLSVSSSIPSVCTLT